MFSVKLYLAIKALLRERFQAKATLDNYLANASSVISDFVLVSRTAFKAY